MLGTHLLFFSVASVHVYWSASVDSRCTNSQHHKENALSPLPSPGFNFRVTQFTFDSDRLNEF